MHKHIFLLPVLKTACPQAVIARSRWGERCPQFEERGLAPLLQGLFAGNRPRDAAEDAAPACQAQRAWEGDQLDFSNQAWRARETG